MSTLRPVVLAAAAFAIACAATIVGDYNPRSPLMPVGSKAVLAVLVVVVTPAWLSRGRLRTWAPDLTVAVAAAFAGGILAGALHGSDYPVGGLSSDIGFRVAAVTRFSDTWQLVDFSYRGLPAFYPPLMPWTVGRAAALFDLTPYSALKHASIVMAFAVPLLSYLQWRRVVSPALAALIALGAPLAVSNFILQPESWVALFLIVPWWLDAVYGIRRHGVRELPVWANGLIGAALFCLYYYYFFILAVALLLLPALNRLHPPADRRRWRRLEVLAIAATLSAVYWLPLLVSIVETPQPASLQNLYFDVKTHPEHDDVVVDVFDGSVVGFLMLAGLAHLTWTVLRQRLSAGLLLLVAAGYAWYVIGFGLAAAGKPVLAFRTERFVELVLVIAGIKAGAALVRAASARWRPGDVTRVAALLAAALVFVLGQSYVNVLLNDPFVRQSHDTASPNGGLEPYASSGARAPGVPAARVLELVRAVHGGDGRPVVLASGSDLLRSSPVYLFNEWQAIYAHPAGEFLARLEFTRQLARERDPGRLAALARGNRFDPIDVFVLRSAGENQLVYEVSTVDFPHGSRRVRIPFARDRFDRSRWKTVEAGDWFIAAPR